MARIRIDDLPVAEGLTPEQEALILGAGLKSFRPSLEALEDRQLMAAGITVMQVVPAIVTKQVEIANQNQLQVINLKQDVEKAIRPGGTPIDLQGGVGSIRNIPQGGTALQRQLQAAIAGPGGRVDLQQVGKLILDAAQREAKALWGNKVEAGVVQLGLYMVTQFDHGVRVTLMLTEATSARHYSYRWFDVEIKYDAKGAVTAESYVNPVGSNSIDLPFIQNMNKALGVPGRPPSPSPNEDLLLGIEPNL
jgi:hypothetical protein